MDRLAFNQVARQFCFLPQTVFTERPYHGNPGTDKTGIRARQQWNYDSDCNLDEQRERDDAVSQEGKIDLLGDESG